MYNQWNEPLSMMISHSAQGWCPLFASQRAQIWNMLKNPSVMTFCSFHKSERGERRACSSSVLAHHTSVSPQTLGIIPPVAPRSHFIWGFLKWRRVRRGMVWHRQSCPVPWQPGWDWSHKNIKEDFDWWGSHLPAQNPHTISNCILYLGLSSGQAKTTNISVSVDNRQFSFKGFIFILHNVFLTDSRYDSSPLFALLHAPWW